MSRLINRILDVMEPSSGTLTKTKPDTKPLSKTPPMYRVLMLNDDFTPMEFVVELLVAIFKKPISEAEQIMQQIHLRGIGVCGVYAFEIAETKVAQVRQNARQAGHPLRCTMEPSA